MASTSWMSVSPRRFPDFLGDLCLDVWLRVERAFDGDRWLARALPPRSLLTIEMEPHQGNGLEVGPPREVDWDGPKEVTILARLPRAWLDDGNHGLLAVRILRATLAVFDRLAAHYDLGPPPLRPPRAGRGKPELPDPFSPRPPVAPETEAAAAALERLARDATAGQLLVAACTTDSGRMSAGRDEVLRALGTTEMERGLRLDNAKEVHAWLIRMGS